MNREEINKIHQLVDKMVDDLKKELMSGAEYKPSYTPGSFWNRLKRFWSNVIYGPNDERNRYLYKNKFGALGEKDEPLAVSQSQPAKEHILSLHQYRFLKEQSDSLEKSLLSINENTDSDNIKNLKLFRIIDNWASKFKNEIEKMLVREPAVEPTASVASNIDASSGARLEPMPKDPRSQQSADDVRSRDAIPYSVTPAASAVAGSTEDLRIFKHLANVRKSKKKPTEIWNSSAGWVGLGYTIENGNWILSDGSEEGSQNKLKRLNKVRRLIDDSYDEDDVLSVLQNLHKRLNSLSDEQKQKLKHMNFETWLKLLNDELIEKLNDYYISGLGQLSDYV